ncbi:MAG: hypothetical protein AAGJ18_07995, partial [Bacteroidota bacterium]
SIKQIYSYEYGMYKSNPKFFERLLSENQELELKDLLLIDDSQSKLDSAFEHGISGIQFVNNEQVFKEINKYDKQSTSKI